MTKILLAIIAVVAFLVGVGDAYLQGTEHYETSFILTLVVFSGLALAWYRQDVKALGRPYSATMSVALIAFPIGAIPVHLFRSRGAVKGGMAFILFLGFILTCIALKETAFIGTTTFIKGSVVGEWPATAKPTDPPGRVTGRLPSYEQILARDDSYNSTTLVTLTVTNSTGQYSLEASSRAMSKFAPRMAACYDRQYWPPPPIAHFAMELEIDSRGSLKRARPARQKDLLSLYMCALVSIEHAELPPEVRNARITIDVVMLDPLRALRPAAPTNAP